MLYRIHQNLLVNRSTGETIRRGTVSCLPGLGKDKVAILLRMGHITPVKAPKWDAWGGWKLRGERLDATGIDPIAFVEMDAGDVVERTKVEDFQDWDEEAVLKWKEEIKARLGIGSVEERRR